jgi:hypothetical protein
VLYVTPQLIDASSGESALAIVTPPDGGTFEVEQPLLLNGIARDGFGHALPTEDLLW